VREVGWDRARRRGGCAAAVEVRGHRGHYEPCKNGVYTRGLCRVHSRMSRAGDG
jgi:hypothetical protein